MKPKFLTLLLAASFGLPAFAENLSEVYRASLAYDPTFAAARSSFEAAKERVPQSLAGLLPNANLNANIRKNDVETTIGTTPETSNDFTSRGWSITATQPIFRGQNIAAYRQSKISVRLAENEFKVADQDLILRAAQVYFDVLLAQDTLEFTRSQKAAITEQLAAAKRSFEVGTVTITDIHEAQARFDLVTAQEIANQNNLEVKKRAMHTLTGKPIKLLSPLVDKPSLTVPAPASMDDWVERALNGNLQVRIRELAKQIADKEIERARAGHYPTLDLTANHIVNDDQNFGSVTSDNTSTILGLELAVPIYQGGRTSSQVREAVANKEKARQELEDALRNAALQTRQAYLNVTSTEAQVKALEAALSSSEKSLESTRLGLQVGVRTNVDVLDAQQQFFSAKKDLSGSRYNFLLSVLNLKAAIGALSPSDLEEIDRLLDGTSPAATKTSLAPSGFGQPHARTLKGQPAQANETGAPAAPVSRALKTRSRK